MDTDAVQEWWESHDGEGEDDEYAHHPSEVFETDKGLGIVLCLIEDDDEGYQTEDGEVSPDYLIAVQASLAEFLEAHPDLNGKVRIALDFDDGSDGEALVQSDSFWSGDQLIQPAG